MSNRLSLLKSMLAESPKDSFILFAIAKEYEGLGQEEEALQYFLQLKEYEPNYVGLYYHLGKLYEKKGEMATAFHTYKAGMTVARTANDEHAFNELAAAKLYLGDDDDFE